MGAVREWVQHVLGLLKDTATVWWRLAPRLLIAYAVGWGLYELSLIVAPTYSGRWPWLSLATVSCGFVALLSGMVICLRVIGHNIGIRERLPDDAVEDDRDESITRQLAVTLLPFLGIYAVFGEVQHTATQLTINEIVLRGLGSKGVLDTAHPHTRHQVFVLLAVLLGTYVFRRGVDLLHEKTEIRALGLVAALGEGFFMLNLVFGGSYLVTTWWNWVQSRRVSSWLSDVSAGFHTSLHEIANFLPSFVDAAWNFITGPVWNALVDGFFQPVVWLAVAALVYGSHVLSLAEMWRKGEPLTVHLDSERTVALRHQAEADERKRYGIVRRLWLETQEAFFGDVDDKYLPTVQSLRLILRAGVVFLGAYAVVYAVVASLSDWIWYLITTVIGGAETRVWAAWSPLIDLFVQPITGTIRLTLLAVAFAVALDAFRASGNDEHPSKHPTPSVVNLPAPTGWPLDLAPARVRPAGVPGPVDGPFAAPYPAAFPSPPPRQSAPPDRSQWGPR